MSSSTSIFFLISVFWVGDCTFDTTAQTELLAVVDTVLSVPETHSLLIQDGFKSMFFLNDSGVEIEMLRKTMFSQIRTMSSSFYHTWSGFENSAFLGYYQQNTILSNEYSLVWQDNENSSCSYNYSAWSWEYALNVSASGERATPDPNTLTISKFCLEVFQAAAIHGRKETSVDGVVYDCRKRSWYYETKEANEKIWTSIFVDAITWKPAFARCSPLFNLTTEATSYMNGLQSDANGMIGVSCTGVYLEDLAEELFDSFDDVSPLVFIVHRTSGLLVATSTLELGDYYSSSSQTQVMAAASQNDLIRFATVTILNATINSNWPDNFSTVAWARNHSNMYPSLTYEAYYISSMYHSAELDWDLVVVQYVDCPEGSYVNTEDFICSDCIAPADSIGSVAESCTLCVPGYFQNEEDGSCEVCPSGVECDGLSSTSDLTLKADYWRISDSSLDIYECPYDGACVGGSTFNRDGRSYCADGYRGPLCVLCESDRYLSDTNACVHCESNGNVLIRLLRSPRLIVFCIIMCCLFSFFVYYNLYCLSDAAIFVEDYLSTIDEPVESKGKKERKSLIDFKETVRKLESQSDTHTINDLDGSVTFCETKYDNIPESTKNSVVVKHTSRAIYTVSTTVTTQQADMVVTKTSVLPSSWVALMAAKLALMQVKIKALTSYAQIAVSVGFNCSVEFPQVFDSAINVLKFVSLDLISAVGLSCRFHSFDYIHRLLIMTIAPLLVSVVLLSLYVLSALVHQLFKGTGPSKEHLASYVVPAALSGSFKSNEIDNFKRVFAYLDRKATGSISRDVLGKAVSEFEPDLEADQVVAKVVAMFDEANKHHDGVIHFDEFLFALVMARRRDNGTNFSILVDKVEAKVNREYGQTIFFIFLFLTFVVLAGNSTALFHFLKCDKFRDGDGAPQRYLSNDYSIDCDSARYKSYIPFALIMIFVYPIGIPLLYFCLLWEHRVVLRDQRALDREEATGFPTIGHLTFLVSSYSPEYYLFEVLESCRRLVLASLIGIADVGLASTPVLGLLISLVFVWVFTSLKPYKEAEDNTLGVTLSFSITLIFVAALMIKVDLTSYNKAEASFFDALLLLVLFSGPLVLVLNVVFGDPETFWKSGHSGDDRRRSARSVELSYLDSIQAEMKGQDELRGKLEAKAKEDLKLKYEGKEHKLPWLFGKHTNLSQEPRDAVSLDRVPTDSTSHSNTRDLTSTPFKALTMSEPSGKSSSPERSPKSISSRRSPTKKGDTATPQRSPYAPRSPEPAKSSKSLSPAEKVPKKTKKSTKTKLQVMNEMTAVL